MQREVLCIAGARPNFMKVAPLVRALTQYPGISAPVIHTGQHYDEKMSDIFFAELGIPKPTVNLQVGSLPRLEQIAAVRAAFTPIVERRRPDLVVVVGDVNSTIACASVAKAFGVRVAHVEAGLRSFDLEMPEEHNRRETDAISDFLFVTEESGVENLRREGTSGVIHFVGNVMIDTLVYNRDRISQSTIRTQLGLQLGSYAVVTFHRPSNVDELETLQSVLDVLRALGQRVPVVFPLHPRTRASLERHELFSTLEALPGLICTEPLGYVDFLALVENAKVVVTDSGGIQEETTFLGVPCVTVRENTERPSTTTVGSNTLVGRDPVKAISVVDEVLAGRYRRCSVPPLWDGRAAERIADILVRA